MTYERTGCYIGLYATLGVEKRRDGSVTDRKRRLAIIVVEEKGWKGKRHYQRNLTHELNHAVYTIGVCFQRIILYKKNKRIMAFDVFLLDLLRRECSTFNNIKPVINIIANIYLH